MLLRCHHAAVRPINRKYSTLRPYRGREVKLEFHGTYTDTYTDTDTDILADLRARIVTRMSVRDARAFTHVRVYCTR